MVFLELKVQISLGAEQPGPALSSSHTQLMHPIKSIELKFVYDHQSVQLLS